MSGIGAGFSGFGDAIGATGMIRSGHGDFCAEIAGGLGNPFVVGGDHRLIEVFGLLAALPNVLDQRFSADHMKRLAREARGAPARWEDADDARLGRHHLHEATSSSGFKVAVPIFPTTTPLA